MNKKYFAPFIALILVSNSLFSMRKKACYKKIEKISKIQMYLANTNAHLKEAFDLLCENKTNEAWKKIYLYENETKNKLKPERYFFLACLSYARLIIKLTDYDMPSELSDVLYKNFIKEYQSYCVESINEHENLCQRAITTYRLRSEVTHHKENQSERIKQVTLLLEDLKM